MINYILHSDCSLVPPKEKWGFTVWKMWTKHYNFYMNRKCTLRTWVPMISWMAAHASPLVSSGPSFSDFRWPIFEIHSDRNICNVYIGIFSCLLILCSVKNTNVIWSMQLSCMLPLYTSVISRLLQFLFMIFRFI